MSKKNTKPKFIPPISTAASFLRSISKSPESTKLFMKRPSLIKEFVPDFPKSIEPQIKLTQRQSILGKNLAISSPKYARDVSHLQDVLKSSKSDSSLPPLSSLQILPTNPDHLKVYLDASECHSRCSSRSGHLCQKEKCLEEFLDRSIDLMDKKKAGDESQRNNLQLGLPSGKQDIHNLKEWYRYMKELHIKKVLNEKNIERLPYQDLQDDVQRFELVIRAGMKECTRQVTVQSLDRGTVLSEMVEDFEAFWRIKNAHILTTYKQKNKQLKLKNAELQAQKQEINELSNEAMIKIKKELEVSKSNSLLKDVEIERLSENIKKLKAERTFRIKKELETYNEMLRKFKEYREAAAAKADESSGVKPDESQFKRKMQKTKDSIKDLMLAKLNLIERRKSKIAEGLTEEQLIEHQMLITDDEFPFKDIEVQVEINKPTKEQWVNAVVKMEQAEVETDELLDYIAHEDLHSEHESIEEIPKIPNIIFVTNEKNEEALKLSVNSPSKEGQKKPFIFKYRLKMEKTTQTDDKVFLQITKQEEEELVSWMIKDRKDYLRTIQRQIFHKKNELSRVNDLIVKTKPNIENSLIVEDRGLSSLNSSIDMIDSVIDTEIENLRNQGIIGEEHDIESWKHGYYFGYDRGKIEGFSEGEKLGKERAELDIDLPVSADVTQIEQKSTRTSIRKSTLAIDDIKRDRKTTKIQEFHFQRKEVRGSTTKLEHKQNLLDSFLTDSLKEIVKNTKMSKKMTIKTISTIYVSAVAKKSSTHSENLADFTYEEFYSKYSQKSVASKKFIDFIAALLKYPDSRKVINFCRLLGIGKKLGLEDFVRLKESFHFIMLVLEKISKSTLGIIIGVDETSEYQFIPTIRALECSREVLGQFCDSVRVQRVLEGIDKNSHPDPKKINKSGIIDQELMHELLLNEFDEHQKGVIDTILQLFEGVILMKKASEMHKKDFVMVVRHISQKKFEEMIGANDPIDVLNKELDSVGRDGYEKCSKLVNVCYKYGLLQISEINSYYHDAPTLDEAKKIIVDGLEQCQALLRYVLSHRESLGLSEEYALIWEQRIHELQTYSHSNPRMLVIAWKVFFSEITRLTKA